MPSKWLRYYQAIKTRTHFNGHFVADARVVAGLYRHFKWGKGKRSFERHEKLRTIAFYPDPVGPWYNIWLVVQNTKLKITKDIENADYVFIFHDETHSNAASQLGDDIKAVRINDKVTDISKSHVSHIFKSVFGYDIQVDPTTFIGKIVEKSDENGTHDGRIIAGPIAREDIKSGYCYQRFIDSSFSGQTSEDLRIACVFGKIGAVFHKHKAFDEIFTTSYLSTTVHEPSEKFGPEEENLIEQFCGKMGLDFGAIDVMRDKVDGKIYIVDVNKTCMPVLSLPRDAQLKSLGMISQLFTKRLPQRG